VRHLQYGADHLLYRLADEVVAGFMPVVEKLDDEIDRISDLAFDRPSSETLAKIFQIKRAAIHLRRILGPQREVLNKLARDDYAAVDTQSRVYFRDVYDRLVHLYDIAEGLRDLIAGTLDLYLSAVNNRMNDIMKSLTVITTLFLPLSFLTGFFGMNFFSPSLPVSSLVNAPVFPFVLLLMVASPLLVLFWMKRQGWM
jgi:magnesium transporter